MRFPKSDHCDGEHFFTPGAPKAKGLREVIRWKMTTRAAPWPERVAIGQSESRPPSEVRGDRCRVTLINHSTVLIQYAGINVLTDPIWSERASPFSQVGPRRHAPPGVRFEELPRIDAVLLSHNHYDHLDRPTVERLQERDRPQFVAPLGVAEYLSSIGIRGAREMDWWDEMESFVCVPAQHFSARSLSDRNRTLWCGYWISTPAGPVYFAADTGFGPHVQEIRRRLGSPRLALLPIGAYEPKWFMGPIHMSPTEAVAAHQELGAERSIAIHWGTFQMGDDGPKEALGELREAMVQSGAAAPFLALENGEWIELPEV